MICHQFQKINALSDRTKPYVNVSEWLLVRPGLERLLHVLWDDLQREDGEVFPQDEVSTTHSHSHTCKLYS